MPADSIPARLQEVVDRDDVAEAVLLSTCNRVELYLAPTESADSREVAAAGRALLGPPSSSVYAHTGRDAATHLFRVSGSLDSMVLGEPQILGQVKEAFARANDAGTVGTILNGCFNRAFKSAKRIRTETAVARAAVSVGYVAVELAKTIFGALEDVSVLLVGAGKMGILAAKNLSDSGAKRVQVANRTFERGKAVADRFGWSASAYGDLPILLGAVDVVICSTGSPHAVLTPDMIKVAVKKRRYRPLFLIDIAVPRDIDPGCGQFDDVYLYNIDDLEEVSRTNRANRAEAVDQAEEIVVQESLSFERWSRERRAAPTIKMLRQKALSDAAAEAAKTLKMLPGLDEKGAATVQKLAEVIASRLIRGPIAALKNGAGSAEGDDLAALVQQLYDLEQE